MRLNAARALAYMGYDDGSIYLKDCASGKIVLSSSLFERDAAALALLFLGEKLPDEYLNWNRADPLYVMF
ncbi:hypothetical protein JW935_17075 [candidate division KSB1 bacterium]|nr:hypothetical protein [candidate division KSB1 bacterium]